VIPAGLVLDSGSAASFETQGPRVIHGRRRSPSYRLAGGGHGCSSFPMGVRSKGCRRHSAATAIISNYSRAHIATTWEAIRSFKGGTAVFRHPATPIKLRRCSPEGDVSGRLTFFQANQRCAA